MKINDILQLAKLTYNLNLNPKTTEAIQRKLRRTLAEKKIKPPYNLTREQANYLVNVELKPYFFKKATITNKNLDKEKELYNKLTQEHKPDNTTYTQALKDLQSKFIFQALLKLTNTKFNENEFKKDYKKYRDRVDINGYPLPGYIDAKEKLLNINNYFKKDSKEKTAQPKD